MIPRAALPAVAAVALLVGGCTSNPEEKNYKLLEEDRPMFDTSDRPTGDARPAGPVMVAWAAPDDAEQIDVISATEVDAEQTPAAAPSTRRVSSEFADRTAWEPVVIGPVRSGVRHWPHYFSDWDYPPGRQRGDTLSQPDQAFDQVIGDDRHQPLSGRNLAAGAMQMGKFGVDLVALPIRLVLTPPWTTQTSSATEDSIPSRR